MLKETGIRITAHQFRHAAAAVILRAQPGNYEYARRILGHLNVQTTTNFYAGLETFQAGKHFGELIESRLEMTRRGRRNESPIIRSLGISEWPYD